MSVGALASAAGAAPENGGGASQDGSARMSSPVPDAATSEIERQVQEVLSSEIGISTLLNRLKQTISSAKVRSRQEPSPQLVLEQTYHMQHVN